MKLRQAIKILKRIHSAAYNHQLFGTPLPKSWRRYMSMWHKANAVYNHHCIPVGRCANNWANKYTAKLAKASREQRQKETLNLT